MSFITLLPTLVVCFVWGISLIAFGQLLLVFREIAFNTRKEPDVGPKYQGLSSIAKVLIILGWIIFILGFVVICLSIFGLLSY